MSELLGYWPPLAKEKTKRSLKSRTDLDYGNINIILNHIKKQKETLHLEFKTIVPDGGYDVRKNSKERGYPGGGKMPPHSSGIKSEADGKSYLIGAYANPLFIKSLIVSSIIQK